MLMAEFRVCLNCEPELMNKANIENWIINKISQELKIIPAKINTHTNVAHYGLGSLQAITICGELEDWLGIKIDYATFVNLKNVHEITNFLYKKTKKKISNIQKQNPGKEGEMNFLASFPQIKELVNLEQKVKEAAGIDLYFCENEGQFNQHTSIEGQTYLNFSSYNYLAFANDQEVMNDAIEAIKQYGTSVSASRLVGGQKPIHSQLEEAIANFLNTEDALVFNSGYLTNVTTIGHLMDSNDLIILDELSHNSLVQGARLSGAAMKFYKHNDTHSLEKILKATSGKFVKTLVVTEGIFSMDGDVPPLNDYIKLKQKFDFLIYVDEAHSLGVLGESGAGIGEYFAINRADVDIWMGTLSKAIASCGGYIAGNESLINYLKYTTPGFVYSCGLSPADTAAALTSLKKLKHSSHRVKRLQELASFLGNELKKSAIDTGLSFYTPIIPILIGDMNETIRLCVALRKRQIYTQAIFPPAVANEASRLRIFVNYSHSQDDLRLLAKTLHNLMTMDATITN
ncbi:aminotransferase class I/II-fold pyridoxal phosphate-dependent enzyme [Legionella cardiaca]|uniref:8-amino-7-oxononanoate synthase n=1 Tax=Legionella cardiaca TaxID=1071983 RepID=A0ABY8AQV9_9GAMM|nr:aminotransferase class I/II-fold pyridoxal phosphate-dependent enzyme [Legionella cardiaca]WED42824.1 aminotransferase class I/II-fold pyridoxal phosphate-dependent enzyme [Legionella cardiaca]